ncbi:MAG: insulinase family protein, partial [Sphingobacteriia bacterium]
HCLSKHLSALLPIVAELIMEAQFPEEELQTYRQNQQQRLEVNLKKCDFIANRLIDEYVYGFHHPYGTYTSTLDYENLERADLVAYHQQFYAKGNCKIFVAGKLPNHWETLLEQVFAPLPLNQEKPAEKIFGVEPATEKKYRIVNDESGVQGAIRLARPFPNRHHPDFQKAMILNNVFGGFFGSRLMSNIREDKGYTYGIHSYVQNHIHTSAWMISTEAGREVCEPTITEVYKEMQRLATEPIPAEELHLVRNYMLGSILGELDGPFQLIARWKNYVLNNLDQAYFYNSLDIIRHTSAEELQELAKKWLNPADFYELVVV